MLGTLRRQRHLVWAFAQRDFRTRYRASALGWLWSLLQPLANLAVFTVVFSLVFRVPAPPLGNGSQPMYVLYLFTGLIPWNLFSSVITLSMVSLRSSGDLLRKVAFPAYAPVLGASLVQLVQVGIELFVLLAWFVAVDNVGMSWLWAPLLLLGLALFAQGTGLLLSTLNARYGDVQYIVTVLLGALYFLTPVLYPVSAIPAQYSWLRALVAYNPVSIYITGLHDSLYSLSSPSVFKVLAGLLLGAVVFLVGLAVFDRTTEDVGELL